MDELPLTVDDLINYAGKESGRIMDASDIIEVLKNALTQDKRIKEVTDFSDVAYDGIEVETTDGSVYTIPIMDTTPEEDEEDESEINEKEWLILSHAEILSEQEKEERQRVLDEHFDTAPLTTAVKEILADGNLCRYCKRWVDVSALRCVCFYDFKYELPSSRIATTSRCGLECKLFELDVPNLIYSLATSGMKSSEIATLLGCDETHVNYGYSLCDRGDKRSSFALIYLVMLLEKMEQETETQE